MKVKATKRGYYGSAIRDPGDQFEIASKEELGSWMEPVKVVAQPKAEPPAAKLKSKAAKDK